MSNKKFRITSLIILIGLVIAIGILSYNLYDLITKYGVNSIASIQSYENQFFDATGSIITERRADYVFPTDSLYYKITWKNKADYPIDITPQIDGTVGEGKSFEQPKDFGMIPLSKDGIATQNYKFSLEKEGQHKLKFIVNVVNHTNKVSLFKMEIPTDLEILSRSDKLQEESNFWTVFGVLLSTSIGGAAVFFTGYHTLKQRKERLIAFRAWVSDSGSDVKIKRILNASNDVRSFEKWKELSVDEQINFKPTQVEWYLYLKNSGQVPAFDIRGRRKVIVNRKPSMADILNEKFGHPFSIMAGDNHQFVFYTTVQEADHLLNEKVLAYLILEIQYKSANSNELRRYGYAARFGDATFMKIHTWTEENMGEEIVDDDIKIYTESELKKLLEEKKISVGNEEELRKLGFFHNVGDSLEKDKK